MLGGVPPGRAPLLSAERNRHTTAPSPTETVPFSCGEVSAEPLFLLRNSLRGPYTIEMETLQSWLLKWECGHLYPHPAVEGSGGAP